MYHKPGHKYERIATKRVHIGELKLGTVVQDAGISRSSIDFGFGHIVGFDTDGNELKIRVQFQFMQLEAISVSSRDLFIYV